jgi:hypothetical protein
MKTFGCAVNQDAENNRNIIVLGGSGKDLGVAISAPRKPSALGDLFSMNKRAETVFLLISLLAVWGFAGQLFAQGPASPIPSGPSAIPGPPALRPPPPGPPPYLPGETASPPPVEKVSPGVFRLGEIYIHKDARRITFPAQVNMTQGLLEYLIVRSSGKVHESLLRTPIDPFHLQVAFLLLGFEGTDRPLAQQGSPEAPLGDPVEIDFTWEKGSDEKVPVKPEEWIARRAKNQYEDVGPISWVYTGSIVRHGRFAAQMEASLVAIFHDPVALVDNASAGGESDKIWFVKEGAVPPVGTPVTVTIKAKNSKN